MARIALNERIPKAWLQSIEEPYHVGLPAPDPAAVEGLLCTLNLRVDGELLDTYAYYLTDTFPYIPRCWKAAPDPSFTARP